MAKLLTDSKLSREDDESIDFIMNMTSDDIGKIKQRRTMTRQPSPVVN